MKALGINNARRVSASRASEQVFHGLGLGFKVRGVWGSGFRDWDLGFRV